MLHKLKTSAVLTSAIVATMFASGGAALAAPIVGAVGFSGEYHAFLGNNETGGQTNDLTQAKSIQTQDGTISVQSVSGDFAAIPTPPPLTDTTGVDLFGDFNLDKSDLPIMPIWQVTHNGVTYAMSLTDFIIESQTPDSLEIEGQGIMTISSGGFDPTLGEFDATFNTTGTAPNVSLTFSNTNASTPVPIPATLGLLGIGLIGLGTLTRLRNSK